MVWGQAALIAIRLAQLIQKLAPAVAASSAALAAEEIAEKAIFGEVSRSDVEEILEEARATPYATDLPSQILGALPSQGGEIDFDPIPEEEALRSLDRSERKFDLTVGIGTIPGDCE